MFGLAKTHCAISLTPLFIDTSLIFSCALHNGDSYNKYWAGSGYRIALPGADSIAYWLGCNSSSVQWQSRGKW